MTSCIDGLRDCRSRDFGITVTWIDNKKLQELIKDFIKREANSKFEFLKFK